MALLEVTDVHVAMGAQEILRGVSLAVPEKAIVAVLGGNGVGKTTLMRAISGIYGISSGSIRFDGEEIGNAKAHAIVRLGLAQAPEGRQIFGTMTVRENLLLGGIALPSGEVDALVRRSLELFPVLLV